MLKLITVSIALAMAAAIGLPSQGGEPSVAAAIRLNCSNCGAALRLLQMRLPRRDGSRLPSGLEDETVINFNMALSSEIKWFRVVNGKLSVKKSKSIRVPEAPLITVGQ